MALDRRDLLERMAVLGVSGLSVSIAGCAGDQDDSTPAGTQTESTPMETPMETPTDQSTDTPMQTPAAAVSAGSHPDYGEVLVDGDGRMLYMFTPDSEGESTCYDDCAEAWPPLTVESADAVAAGSDVTADLGTTERDDGSLQVTAGGLPLYYFVQDEEPGDANGMGLGNVWFLLRPDGSILRPTVSVASREPYGDILTDSAGETLYMFTQDSEGESTCYEDCAAAWPPLTVDSEDALMPAAPVSASLGTTERRDGSLQVTADGLPLYYFADDAEAGDVNGQGVGDVWFVLQPDGSVIMETDTQTSTPM